MTHQYVKAISITQPLTDDVPSDKELQFPRTTEELVSYVARVSNPANQHNFDTALGLIDYLVRNKHWSPFEMVDITLEINTTRDIGRQILRHRSFVFQEFSQRYANPLKDMSFASREARLQDTKNRQNSIDVDDKGLSNSWEVKQDQIIHESKLAYWWAIENGIAMEQARCVLPEGNTMSRLYMKGSLRSWIHYIELRASNGTQKEHREIALLCAEKIVKYFPFLKEWHQQIKTPKKDKPMKHAFIINQDEVHNLPYPWITATYDSAKDYLEVYDNTGDLVFDCYYGLGIADKKVILDFILKEVESFLEDEYDEAALKYNEVTEGYKIDANE